MRARRIRSRHWRLVGALALCALGLMAPSRVATGADADKGYQRLLTRPYDAPFMTEAMLWDVWKVWPAPARAVAEQASPAERRRMIFSRYGLVEEEGRDLPVNFVRTPGGGLTENCLSCHAGKVAGRYIHGLGNSNASGDALASDVALLMEREKLAPPPGAVPFPPGFPMIQPVDAVGVNNAFAGSTIFLAGRDKDLNLMAVPQYPLPPASLFIPDKTPAWWLLKRKQFLYWDGFAQSSIREGFMQFTATPANSAETIKSLEPDFNDIYDWVVSLKAPQYPWPIDKALAVRGLAIFTNNCARCHGSYGPGGKYPETIVELREIGTDPLRLQAFSRDFRQYLGESWFGEYGKIKTVLDPKGYVAPPLDGVWATAPYLHNGSVPTLADLLNPDQRPKAWRRTPDGYDRQKVGIEVEALAEAPGSTGPGVLRNYYDAGLPGLGNGGHRYPPKPLSERDQKALIEYLKTL